MEEEIKTVTRGLTGMIIIYFGYIIEFAYMREHIHIGKNCTYIDFIKITRNLQ